MTRSGLTDWRRFVDCQVIKKDRHGLPVSYSFAWKDKRHPVKIVTAQEYGQELVRILAELRDEAMRKGVV